MTSVLFIIGIASIIGGVIIGLLSGTLFGFVVTILASIMFSLIFFALAKILEIQENILNNTYSIISVLKNPPKKIICKFCSHEYSNTFSSCPNCGRKE